MLLNSDKNVSVFLQNWINHDVTVCHWPVLTDSAPTAKKKTNKSDLLISSSRSRVSHFLCPFPLNKWLQIKIIQNFTVPADWQSQIFSRNRCESGVAFSSWTNLSQFSSRDVTDVDNASATVLSRGLVWGVASKPIEISKHLKPPSPLILSSRLPSPPNSYHLTNIVPTQVYISHQNQEQSQPLISGL